MRPCIQPQLRPITAQLCPYPSSCSSLLKHIALEYFISTERAISVALYTRCSESGISFITPSLYHSLILLSPHCRTCCFAVAFRSYFRQYDFSTLPSNTSLYRYLYLAFFNGLWVVFPLWILYEAYQALNAAMSQAEMVDLVNYLKKAD
jgi:hypothetical protein